MQAQRDADPDVDQQGVVQLSRLVPLHPRPPRLVHAHKYRRKGNRLYEDFLRSIGITTTGRPRQQQAGVTSQRGFGFCVIQEKKRYRLSATLVSKGFPVCLFFKGALGSFICQQMFFISTRSESCCPKLNEAYWCSI